MTKIILPPWFTWGNLTCLVLSRMPEVMSVLNSPLCLNEATKP